MQIRILLLCSFFCASTLTLLAQPANDECANALELTDIVDFCSSPATYTNAQASQSSQETPGCFPDDPNNPHNDIWFRFTAVATDVNIRVIGATRLNTGGTLRNPQLAIYSGTCSDLTLLQCISDNMNNNVAQTFENDLNDL